MKGFILLTLGMAGLLGAVYPLSGLAADKHPEMGSRDCLSCHQMASPTVIEEWSASLHGLNLVQCGVCHGDSGDFLAAPGRERCIGCHSEQVASAAGRNCSSCHGAHNYTVHR